MVAAHGYAAHQSKAQLKPFKFERRDPGPTDIQIRIQFCGVCHSDLHTVNEDWGPTVFPVVPGHEIVGVVTKVGRDVKKFREGDLAGVGCMVGSCGRCPNCNAGEENYCDNGVVFTYGSTDRFGTITYGGYSNNIVVDESFGLKIPANLNLAATAPLLCAGITTYSPMRHWNVQKGHRVGVVGLGGLGHMALKLSHAFGAHTVQFTTSPGKEDDARRLGADEVVLTREPAVLAKLGGTFDFIIDTVSAPHDINAYLHLLKRDGAMVLVGLPEKPMSVGAFDLVLKRRTLAGSLIGGIRETQEMLDFCGQHNIVSDIELIPIQKINEAYVRMLKNDVKYRFVIDMASLG